MSKEFLCTLGPASMNDRVIARLEELGESTHLEMISGTELRDALKENRRLPDWFARQIIQDTLQADIAAGRPVFCD